MQRPNTTLLAPVVPKSPARHGDTALQRGIADKTLRPEVGEELLTGYHPVRVGQEISEHLKDLAVEGDQASSAPQFVAARIKRIVLEDVEHQPLLRRSAGRAGAAQSGCSGQAAPSIAAACAPGISRGRHWLPRAR